MNLFYESIGYVAGICLAISFLPQAWQIFRTKNVSGLSLPTYIIYNVGLICWVVYGFYLHSVQMVLFNSISLSLSLPILYMLIKYRKNK